MQVRVKLFATLGSYRPGVPPGTPFECTLPEAATLADLIALLGVPPAEAKAIFVNGRARPFDWVLAPGDEVGIFPPIGGG